MERIICHRNRLMWVNALWYINPSLSPAVAVKRCHLWWLFIFTCVCGVGCVFVRRVAGSISTLLISSVTADRWCCICWSLIMYTQTNTHSQLMFDLITHWHMNCVPLTLLSLAALWDTLQQKHSRAELFSVYSSDSKSAAIGRLYSDINFSLASGRPISGRFPRSRSVCTHTAGARKSKWKRVKMSCSLFVA